MLEKYRLNGREFDSLDLKLLLDTQGMAVAADEITARFGKTRRCNLTDPFATDLITLSDGIAIHVYQNPASHFTLKLGESGKAYVACCDEFITEVDFPPRIDFYDQRTSRGRRFAEFSVIVGTDNLTFPYLWPCDVARSGGACRFCHCGRMTEQLAREGKLDPSFDSPEAAVADPAAAPTALPTPQEVAEAVDYVFNVETFGYTIQMTGGTRRDFAMESAHARKMLETMDWVAGLKNVPGEVLLYISPPKQPEDIDALFDAGVNRVAMDVEVWDPEHFRRVCPGKPAFFDRDDVLRALAYVVETYGPWRCCTSFVAGAEPLESWLEGVEYVASHGIVPLFPIVNHQNPMMDELGLHPGLDYYRTALNKYAEVYKKYDINSPNQGHWGCCVCGECGPRHDEILQLVA